MSAVGPLGNVADLLRAAAEAFGGRPAVLWPGGTRTWAALDAAADAGAAALRHAGLVRGDRVVIALPTGPDLALALFAAARAGLTAVPVGPGRADAGVVADRVDANAAIADASHGLPIFLGPAALAAWWAGDAGLGAHGAGARASVGGGEELALLARVTRDERPVMLSHRAILAAVRAIGDAVPERLRDGVRVVQVLPLYHLSGWVTGFLPLAAFGGASVIPEIGFDLPADADEPGRPGAAASALAAIRDHRVTIVPAAPVLYRELAEAPGAERALSSVRLMTSGMSPLRPVDAAAIHALTGQVVWEGYGVAEASSVVTSTLATDAPRRGSVGRPLTDIEVRIVGPDGRDVDAADVSSREESAEPVDDDTLADVSDAGEVGRIAIRGPVLFSGYWPDGGGAPDADGWFVTGDVGFLDDAGELHLVDRVAEAIAVAGFTIYPREIEQVIVAHDTVAEAAVFAVPAPDGTQRTVAVLVARAGRDLVLSEIAEYLADRLPEFKRPAVFDVVPALPRTEVGRLDRAGARRAYAARSGIDLAGRPGGDPAASGPDDAAVAEPAGDAGTGPEVAGPEPTGPEPVGELGELGARLPRTGDRRGRGDQDTDDDLF